MLSSFVAQSCVFFPALQSNPSIDDWLCLTISWHSADIVIVAQQASLSFDPSNSICPSLGNFLRLLFHPIRCYYRAQHGIR